MPINISYLEARYDDVPSQRPLEDVIAEIRSGKHKDLTNTIKNETDDEIIKRLKGKLPQFFPTIQWFDKNELSDTSIPTGIVQFDVDLKDNLETDFDILKAEITSIPEVIYAFTSPQGGLKFGVLTDFHKHDGEEWSVMKDRYQQAYDIVVAEGLDGLWVNFDVSVKPIKIACYLAHDENAYLNLSSSTHHLDSRCRFEPRVYSTSDDNVDAGYISELLSFIPTDYGFDARRRINFCVLHHLGNDGINILMNHWTTDDPDKLGTQLKSQSSSCSFGNIGTLINEAAMHGYVRPGQRNRRSMTVMPSDMKMDELRGVPDAQGILNSEVSDFFENGTTKFINVSSSFGKTEAIIQAVVRLPQWTKVLILVPSHKLANELEKRFIQPFDSTLTPLQKLREGNKRPRVRVMKGRGYRSEGQSVPMCNNLEIFNKYESAGIAMPAEQCMSHCMFEGDCSYIEQFRIPSSIRIMTHKEYTNREGRWFHGSDIKVNGTLEPRNQGWKPEYIIVDEDWFERVDQLVKYDSDYSSLFDILNLCLAGAKLEEAIQQHKIGIVEDFTRMDKARSAKVPFTDIESYVRKRAKVQKVEDSAILDAFNDYVQSGFDPEYIRGVYVDNEARCISKNIMKPIHCRHLDVPTLYLDATANKQVVESVLGPVPFVTIQVESKSDIHVHQMENYNWTKSKITTQAEYDRLLSDVKEVINEGDTVGLITYKNTDFTKDFDERLAADLGVEIYGHFGALRGLNEFEGVDVLLIVGRHMLPESELEKYCHAIIEGEFSMERDYVDVPCRMKDGSTMKISNFTYTDSRVLAVHQHFSQSETLQAVGRGRMIHGKKKDIYVFSNESLGPKVEVTDFFRYQEDKKFQKEAEKLRQVGFCQLVPRELKKLGLSEHTIKHNRDHFIKEAKELGARILVVLSKDRHGNKTSKRYLCMDREKLGYHLKDSGLTALEVAEE